MRRSKNERRSNKFDIQGSDRNRDMDNSSPSVKKIDQIVAEGRIRMSCWWEKAQSEGIGNLHELCHKMKWGMPGDDVFKVVITGVAQQAETIRQMTARDKDAIIGQPFKSSDSAFESWWSSTNNDNWFSNKPINRKILKESSYFAWRAALSAREQDAENPLVGHCSYCNSSIWWKQGYMQEDDKFYHIRCLMMKSYDGKLAQQAETIRHLTKSLEEYRNSKGK